MKKLLKIRFKANPMDPRPIVFPLKYPYWCTGYGEGYSTNIGYFENEADVHKFWPEAYELDIFDEVEKIEFSSRFPKPEWYNDDVLISPTNKYRNSGKNSENAD